jgi:hypothetical protein
MRQDDDQDSAGSQNDGVQPPHQHEVHGADEQPQPSAEPPTDARPNGEAEPTVDSSLGTPAGVTLPTYPESIGLPKPDALPSTGQPPLEVVYASGRIAALLRQLYEFAYEEGPGNPLQNAVYASASEYMPPDFWPRWRVELHKWLAAGNECPEVAAIRRPLRRQRAPGEKCPVSRSRLEELEVEFVEGLLLLAGNTWRHAPAQPDDIAAEVESEFGRLTDVYGEVYRRLMKAPTKPGRGRPRVGFNLVVQQERHWWNSVLPRAVEIVRHANDAQAEAKRRANWIREELVWTYSRWGQLALDARYPVRWNADRTRLENHVVSPLESEYVRVLLADADALGLGPDHGTSLLRRFDDRCARALPVVLWLLARPDEVHEDLGSSARELLRLRVAQASEKLGAAVAGVIKTIHADVVRLWLRYPGDEWDKAEVKAVRDFILHPSFRVAVRNRSALRLELVADLMVARMFDKKFHNVRNVETKHRTHLARTSASDVRLTMSPPPHRSPRHRPSSSSGSPARPGSGARSGRTGRSK